MPKSSNEARHQESEPHENGGETIFFLSGRIPRTLIGQGGVRLYNIPGVIYPPKMLRQGHRRTSSGEILPVMPHWAITTQQAADILRCGRSHASALLHRRQIHCCQVQASSGRFITCWNKLQVMNLAIQRHAQTGIPVEQLLTMSEATQLAGVSRTTLTRYVRRGLLKRYSLRRYSPGLGGRISSFFDKKQVEQLINLRKFISGRR